MQAVLMIYGTALRTFNLCRHIRIYIYPWIEPQTPINKARRAYLAFPIQDLEALQLHQWNLLSTLTGAVQCRSCGLC